MPLSLQKSQYLSSHRQLFLSLSPALGFSFLLVSLQHISLSPVACYIVEYNTFKLDALFLQFSLICFLSPWWIVWSAQPQRRPHNPALLAPPYAAVLWTKILRRCNQ